MPILDDLGQFLQANGFGTLGVDLFLATIPQDPPGPSAPDAVLGLFEIPGMAPEHVHDIRGPAVEQAAVQCRWRGSPFGYAAIREQAGAAFRLLDSVVNQAINGVGYRQILALSSPRSLPADEWNRPTVLFEILCYRDGQAP